MPDLDAVDKHNPAGVMYPLQVKAARMLLDWDQDALAKCAGISKTTLGDFERGLRQPIPATLRVLRETLEHNGVIFISADDVAGPGVRLRALPSSW